jgi:hypothetical protein
MTLYKIQLRRDTAANWVTANPVLSAGEFGYELDTGMAKVGNGSSAWSSLLYNRFGGGYLANGTAASPNAIVAAAGISILGAQRELQFIRGSGGPVVVSAALQIAPGTTVGQELTLRCTDAFNTVTLQDGNGLSLDGPIMLGGPGQAAAAFVWDSNVWFGVPPS